MAYRNLDEFLIRLEQDGQLLYIDQPIHTDLEIAAITAEMTARPTRENKALWFNKVTTPSGMVSNFPVVTNIFGTRQRMAWALGLDDLDDLNTRLESLMNIDLSAGFGTLINRFGTLFSAVRSAGIGRQNIGGANVQAVQLAPDVNQLPIVRNWPGETFPALRDVQLIVYDPNSGKQLVRTTSAVMCNGHTLGIPQLPCFAGDEPLHAAIVIGGDPAAMWCSDVPLPERVDPYWLAGWLRGKPVPLAPTLNGKLRIPTDAEIIIEGLIDPTQPFNTTILAGQDGFYMPHQIFTPMQVTAITHREDAVFPASVVTPTPSERAHRDKASERLLLPILRTVMEEVVETNLPTEGSFYNLAIVSIQQSYPGQSQKAMFGLWGLGQIAFNRALVVVDADIDVQDLNTVARCVLNNVDWLRDATRVQGVVRTHSAGQRLGGKIGLDATHKPDRPPLVRQEPATEALNQRFGQHWHLWDNALLLVGIQPDMPHQDLKALVHELWEICPNQSIILVDEGVDLYDWRYLGQFVLASVEWSGDVIIQDATAHPQWRQVALIATRRDQPAPIRPPDHQDHYTHILNPLISVTDDNNVTRGEST